MMNYIKGTLFRFRARNDRRGMRTIRWVFNVISTFVPDLKKRFSFLQVLMKISQHKSLSL